LSESSVRFVSGSLAKKYAADVEQASQQAERERFQLRRLVQLLSARGHPLTGEQVSQLVSIMRDQREIRDRPLRSSPGTTAHAQEIVSRMDDFDRAIEPRFEALLSPEQQESATQYFAGRMERRHRALDAHLKLSSEGVRVGFTFPAD
jgi:hypothetical protein